MAQIEVEVLSSLPHSARETGSKNRTPAKFQVVMKTLDANRDNKTFFIKLKNVDKKGRYYLGKILKEKFGTMWDVLKDDYVETLVYIRKNPYYEPPKKEDDNEV